MLTHEVKPHDGPNSKDQGRVGVECAALFDEITSGPLRLS